MKGIRAEQIAIGIIMILLFVGNAVAATQLNTCMEINSPGEYVLSADIISGGSDCILISTDNIILDGAGFIIDGVNKQGFGVYVYNPILTPAHITVKNLTVKNFSIGIAYEDSQFAGNVIGDIENNIIIFNDVGIRIMDSSQDRIFKNEISHNNIGILALGDGTGISGNNINKNGIGIEIRYSPGNLIANNSITTNQDYGIYLESSLDNWIFNNYFDNLKNARDNGNNHWNYSKQAGKNIIGGNWIGGNYWSDYTGVDQNNDGLGDTLLPYNSASEIVNGGDFLPLVAIINPVSEFSGIIIPIISLIVMVLLLVKRGD